METYQTRTLLFKELVEVNSWKIKVYTISKMESFDHPLFYNEVISKLPEWLNMKNRFNDTNTKSAFLILHEGSEGLFSLINWWVGSNMLNTHIFITNPKIPDAFELISGSGLAPCIWELEIINHERVSWTENVVKKAPNMNLEAYFKDVINKTL